MNAANLEYFIYMDSAVKRQYKGTFSIDNLPNMPTQYPCFIICNTSKSHQYDGHWVVLNFIDSVSCKFFDSYGRPPHNCNNGNLLFEYLKNFNVEYNNAVLQSTKTSVCGFYCLYTIYYLCRNVSMEKALAGFSSIVKDNDNKIINLVHNLYL